MRQKVFENVTESIGNTPLVRLSKIAEGRNLFGKMEFLNPGGSVKDRIALRILEDAYKSHTLEKGQPVVEMTSGNTGAGLAVVCNNLGNPFIAFMSKGQSRERAAMLEALGVELHLVPQIDGVPGKVTGRDIEAAEKKASEFAQEIGAFYVDQFNREEGVKAHEDGTGPEIWEALEEKVDAFVAAIGSAGTFVGVSRFLKSKRKDVFCVAVEPSGAEVLSGKSVSKPRHLLQGTGYGFVPPKWEPELADQIVSVTDEEAEIMKAQLAKKEGLFIGYSAAANVVAAIKLLDSGALPSDANVVTILCDTGFKYLN